MECGLSFQSTLAGPANRFYTDLTPDDERARERVRGAAHIRPVHCMA